MNTNFKIGGAVLLIAVIAGATIYWLSDSSQNPTAPVVAKQADSKGKVLYYRNPMGLPDTSPVPKKDAMGMEYVPVYANDANTNAVQVSPDRVQMLGVRTAPVELRSALARTVRVTGNVQFDERHLATVTTKVSGWVERLFVATPGANVRAGDPLLSIYSPDLVAAEEEYLVVANMGSGSMVHGDSHAVTEASLHRLRALDVPAGEIERLERTGASAHDIAVLAPANGVVTEKDASLGMHVDPGMPLYKTADLSDVWLIAEMQEQDLGAISAGQKAEASFVAFPNRKFEGMVDYIYPALDPETRTAKVRIVIPNADGLLRADMYATVEIALQPAESQSMLTVPDSAILDSGTKKVVLVVKGKGLFEPRTVETGARGDGFTQIVSGLSQGEQVVTSANFLIDAESNLRAALRSFDAMDSKRDAP